MTPPALQLSGIRRTFGSVLALDGAAFVLRPGTVHALLGENGAGKTTLMHIAFGLLEADAGEIHVDGRPVRIGSPRDAHRLGIGMVHQHFTSIDALTVRENLLLAGGRTGGQASGLALLTGLDPQARVETLSVGLKQRLEVAKALGSGARILLLDEPTAVLVPSEIEELLRTIREFAAGGGAAVLITHKLDEVFAVADEVTVLRQGRVVYTGPTVGQTPATLATAMIGESELRVAHRASREPAQEKAPVVRLQGVTIRPRNARSPGLRDATLEVLPGEILGIAAVEGSGQRELTLAIAGVLRPTAGTLEVIPPVVLVPEDRSTEGLIPAMSLAENVVLGRGADPAWNRGPWLDWASADLVTRELIGQFDVRAPGPRVPASKLSGGNQQKLILARGLSTRPRVLVVENPTRGLDIRATAFMHARLRDAAAEGMAVVLYSSDLDEVLLLATRLVVVCRGQVTDRRPPFDRMEVGQAMLGVATSPV